MDDNISPVDCKDRPDCEYKQLKRLEQENRELERKAFLAEQNVRTTASTFCEKDNKINELEQENRQMKSALDIMQRMVLSAWEQGKYLDGGLYDDLTNEFAKINEVLG